MPSWAYSVHSIWYGLLMSCDFIWTEVLESVNYFWRFYLSKKFLHLMHIKCNLFIERPNIFKYFQKSRKLKEVWSLPTQVLSFWNRADLNKFVWNRVVSIRPFCEWTFICFIQLEKTCFSYCKSGMGKVVIK